LDRPSGVIHTLRPAFIWYGDYAYTHACMPTGYRFELSLDPSFGSTVAAFDAPDDPSFGWIGWTPDSDLVDCTNYYWRVAAKNGSTNGPFGNQTFRTQVGTCVIHFVFIPLINANCRIGPSGLYDNLAILTPGDRLPVLARHMTEQGIWYKLQLPNQLMCWASGVGGKFEGDPNGPPISNDYPALPPPKQGGGPAPCVPSKLVVCPP
jgi:hypothetical protein